MKKLIMQQITEELYFLFFAKLNIYYLFTTSFC